MFSFQKDITVSGDHQSYTALGQSGVEFNQPGCAAAVFIRQAFPGGRPDKAVL